MDHFRPAYSFLPVYNFVYMTSVEFLSLVKENCLLSSLLENNLPSEIGKNIHLRSAEAGQVLIEAESKVEFIYILLSGETELLTVQGGAAIPIGNVEIGSILSLYAVLNAQVYPNSVRFLKAGSYCQISKEKLKLALQDRPALKTYLHSISENGDLKRLDESLKALGCSQNFRIEFISELEIQTRLPDQSIFHSESEGGAIYILDGQVTSVRMQQEQGLSFELPIRIWLDWFSTEKDFKSASNYQCLTSTKLLFFSRDAHKNLSKLFPEDIQTVTNAILSGRNLNKFLDEPDETIDIDELIARYPIQRSRLWRSYPWVHQHDSTDCGAACLSMISVYFGRNLSVQFWRRYLSTDKEGTNLFDLAQTSESRGLITVAMKIKNLQEMDADLFPVIAVRQSHFLVIYKVDKKHIIFGDPAVGIRKLTHDEFSHGFEGTILFLRPTEDFFSNPESRIKYSHVLSLLKGMKLEISIVLMVSMGIVGLGVFAPVLTQIFLDEVLVNHDQQFLWIVLGGLTVLAGFSGFLKWAQTYYSNFVAVKFDFRARSVFFKKMLSLDTNFFASRNVGDFTSRLRNIETIRTFFLESFETIIISILSLAFYLIAISFYSTKISLTLFMLSPVMLLLSYLGGKKLTPLYQKIAQDGSDLESSVTDTVKGIAVVKSLNAQLASRWRYEEKLITYLKTQRRSLLTASSIGVLGDFISHLISVLVMGLGAYLALYHSLSPGSVIAIMMLSAGILEPINKLSGIAGRICEFTFVVDRLNDVFLAPSEDKKNKAAFIPKHFQGEIEFRDVWFKYGGEASDWVLNGVSFKIRAGQNLAIVGASGSGKSTIAALVARQFEPTKGQIFIDGRDYLDYNLEWLRSKIGVLHQEGQLFQGTIIENIVFSEPVVDMERAEKAAKQAVADNFIKKKPSDYSYFLAPGGVGLSAGEKQRLSMARTLYRQPKVLIMDEGTASLDGLSERNLLKNLKEEVGQMTIMNVAHRLSTVRFSDVILVIAEGRVAGYGTYSSLKLDNAVFQELFGLEPQVIEHTGHVQRSL